MSGRRQSKLQEHFQMSKRSRQCSRPMLVVPPPGCLRQCQRRSQKFLLLLAMAMELKVAFVSGACVLFLRHFYRETAGGTYQEGEDPDTAGCGEDQRSVQQEQ